MVTISPIKAFSDNYIWLIERGQQAFVVDPGEPDPVLTRLAERGLELTGILITHHHFDHTGAVKRLQEKTGCDTWGPAGSPAGEFDHTVSEGDCVSVMGESFEVLEVPGTPSTILLTIVRHKVPCFAVTRYSSAAVAECLKARQHRCAPLWKSSVRCRPIRESIVHTNTLWVI